MPPELIKVEQAFRPVDAVPPESIEVAQAFRPVDAVPPESIEVEQAFRPVDNGETCGIYQQMRRHRSFRLRKGRIIPP